MLELFNFFKLINALSVFLDKLLQFNDFNVLRIQVLIEFLILF